MSSLPIECLRVARAGTERASARFFHKGLHLALALACGLGLAAGLRFTDEGTDWRRRLAEADAALSAGDRNRARHLYSRAARLAVWQSDWHGALAAACGMSRVEKPAGDYFATRSMLIRVMIVGEKHQSTAALHAAADAFASIGEHDAAAMVRGRLRKVTAQTHSPSSLPQACH